MIKISKSKPKIVATSPDKMMMSIDDVQMKISTAGLPQHDQDSNYAQHHHIDDEVKGDQVLQTKTINAHNLNDHSRQLSGSAQDNANVLTSPFHNKLLTRAKETKSMSSSMQSSTNSPDEDNFTSVIYNVREWMNHASIDNKTPFEFEGIEINKNMLESVAKAGINDESERKLNDFVSAAILSQDQQRWVKDERNRHRYICRLSCNKSFCADKLRDGGSRCDADLRNPKKHLGRCGKHPSSVQAVNEARKRKFAEKNVKNVVLSAEDYVSEAEDAEQIGNYFCELEKKVHHLSLVAACVPEERRKFSEFIAGEYGRISRYFYALQKAYILLAIEADCIAKGCVKDQPFSSKRARHK
eukprot:jgi/Bigna1/140967/aug1.59_g15675